MEDDGGSRGQIDTKNSTFARVRAASGSAAVGLGLCLSATEAWRYPAILASPNESWTLLARQTTSFPITANLLSIAMLLGLIAYYAFSSKRVLRGNLLVSIVACGMSASLYVHYSLDSSTDANVALLLASRLHIALGMVLLAAWAEELLLDKSTAMTTAILSLLVVFGTQFALGLIVSPIAKGASALLPILSLLFLVIHRRRKPTLLPFASNPHLESPHKTASLHKIDRPSNLVLMALCMVSYGVLFSNLHSTWYSIESGWNTFVIQGASSLGSLLAALVLMSVYPKTKCRLLEAVVLLFALFSLYFSTLDPANPIAVLYLMPLNAAQKTIVILLLAVCLPMPTNRVRLFAFFVLYASYRVGLSMLSIVQMTSTVSPVAKDTLFMAAVAYLVGHALYALASAGSQDASPEDETGSARRETQPEHAMQQDRERERREIERFKDMAFYYFLGQKYQLTQREIEILPLLLDMKNADSVAHELTIARTTAKSHIRNVYHKFDVHSQSELAEAMREERARF